jgi:hypothetical protein
MIKFNYWYSPKFIQSFIKWVTPKQDDFTCVVTKQFDGTWTFSQGWVKNEPFVGGSDWVISTIYTDKTYSVPEDGAKAKITVSVNKPDKYDTCFSDPVPTTNGHFYTCSYTQAQAYVCDVKDVFMSKTDKFYITVEPII